MSSNSDRARDEAERSREERRARLRGPSSYLAAVARHEVPVGETLRLEGHVIEALPEGFRVDGAPSGPRTIDAGRYRLRLSHQNAAFRYLLALEADRADLAIGSTREHDRAATRAGWFRFTVGAVACRLAALRLREPGVAPDALELYFSDATSGRETYRMRYVDLKPQDDGRYVVDFNRAYNPACVFSPYYNCPIPPADNRLPVAIRVGERMPKGINPQR